MKLTIALTKIGQSIDVDTLRLCGNNETDANAFDSLLQKYPASVGYFFMYGCKKSLNDAHATVSHKGPEIIRVASEKRLAAVYNGKVKTREGGGTRETDPVLAECIRLAKVWWKKQDQKKVVADTKAKYPALATKSDMEVLSAILNSYVNNPATVAKAKATVAAKAMKVEDVVIDLSILGLADEDESEDETDDESDDDTLMIEDHT